MLAAFGSFGVVRVDEIDSRRKNVAYLQLLSENMLPHLNNQMPQETIFQQNSFPIEFPHISNESMIITMMDFMLIIKSY